jgi:hypothetical protein
MQAQQQASLLEKATPAGVKAFSDQIQAQQQNQPVSEE